MQGVSLTPMAGAQGELAGVAMIMAYHKARGDLERNEILVPDAAHGTNPATATMCGCTVKEVPTLADGDVDQALVMLTPQSMTDIDTIARSGSSEAGSVPRFLMTLKM